MQWHSVLGIDIELQSYACDDREGRHQKSALAARGIGWCSRPEMKSWIKIGEKDAVQAKRGWNIVVINHMTGTIEASRNFDTCNKRAANHDMNVWVRGIRNKRIIVGVAHDDFGGNFDHRGIEALVRSFSFNSFYYLAYNTFREDTCAGRNFHWFEICEIFGIRLPKSATKWEIFRELIFAN